MRYNTIPDDFINPLFVRLVGYGGYDPRNYPLSLLMTAKEVAFWMYRVKTLKVSGAITYPTGKTFVPEVFSGTLIGGGGGTELADYQASLKTISGIFPQTTPPPGMFPDQESISMTFGGGFIHDTMEPTGLINWNPQFNYASITAGNTADPGGGILSSLVLILQGSDLVTGDTYSHTIPLYRGAGLDSTGTVLIEPNEFWPFSDGTTSLYDSTTGALL